MPLPARGDLDALLLDAGNTLIGMDADLVCELLGREGITATPPDFLRAEAAARPALSRRLQEGTSSEAAGSTIFYVRTILTGLGVDGDADAIAARLVVVLRTGLPARRLWSRVLPGVPEALATLRASGLRLVVVSNSDGSVEDGLTDVGLRPLLDAVVDSARVGVEKPAPGIFRHALELAGCPASRALHVGDLYAVDVVGARAAGIDAVLLDPYGDWRDVDCERIPDVPTLARDLVGGA